MNITDPSKLVAGHGKAPSLVILGAPRCGTTSLAAWLRDSGLGVGTKDSFYLMDEGSGLRGPTHVSSEGVSGYLDLFPTSPRPTAEIAAGYLYQTTALNFFSRWAEPPQFAVVLRDPIDRLLSVYRYFSGNLALLPRDMHFQRYVDALFSNTVGLPDETVSDALQHGAYAVALKPWFDAFGSDRIHLVTFDAVARSPKDVVTHLLRVAGGTPEVDLDTHAFESYNSSHIPRSRLIAKATAIGRRLMPAGAVRSWGGEKMRRLQARGTRQAEPAPTQVDNAVIGRLRDYYRDPNAALGRLGVDVTSWQ